MSARARPTARVPGDDPGLARLDPLDLELRTLDRRHGEPLLELTRVCPIEADFTFLFARDPDFFAWPDAAFARAEYRGVFVQDRLVAAALLAVADGVGGARDAYGYGGDLRVLPALRRRGLGTTLVKDALAHLPDNDELELGYFLIKDGNVAAERAPDVFVAGGVVPIVHRVVALNVPLVRRLRGPGTCRTRRAGERDVEPLAALYRRVLGRRPFAPILSPERLVADAARVPGLALDRTYLAERGGRLAGAITAWDQGPLRRTQVLRYSARGHLQRAAFRAAGLLFGSGASLPRPGEALRTLTMARLAVDGDDPAVLADLLAAVTADHVGRGLHLMTLGFVAGDPLIAALRGSLAMPFRSRMFVLALRPPYRLDLQGLGRPYVELARV